MSVQGVIIIVGGLVLLVLAVRLVRIGLLSVRYGLGWIAVAVVAVAGAPILYVSSTAVSHHGFTSTGFSLGVIFIFLALVCLQLSISVSGLHRAVQDLSEYSALLERRLAALESEPKS